MLAAIEAIEAKDTFAYPDIAGRLAAAFAIALAQFAVDTLALGPRFAGTLLFADSPYRKSINNPE
jgi:hypothetical protein